MNMMEDVFFLTKQKDWNRIYQKKWVFTVQFYDSSGLLVSFFIVVISCRYLLPSSECFIRRIAVNILYLSKLPVLSSYTGSPNLISYLYQPYLASLLCFCSLFSSQRGFLAIFISSGMPLPFFLHLLMQFCFSNLHIQTEILFQYKQHHLFL